MEDKALRITLSHPDKTRAIASARIKTDKKDLSDACSPSARG
ncbi:MAG: hypothetical protein Q8M92_06770 [Candidatus Subteraquimicrobiales bacterium]|nr:hypothetical protein [Candidatus Subteraquimicrobiales bacterium]